jgi:predicted aspartyl protease
MVIYRGLLVWGGLVPTVQAAEEIALVKEGGVYSLPVEVNGVLTLPFILDTGAAEVQLPAEVALTLWRAGTILTADLLPGKPYVLADGTVVNSQRFLLRSLRLGTRLISHVPASIGSPLSPLLLGQSLLDRVGPLGIDSQRRVLVLGALPMGITPAPPVFRPPASLQSASLWTQ